jgi:hypothetical protein
MGEWLFPCSRTSNLTESNKLIYLDAFVLNDGEKYKIINGPAWGK